MADKKEISVCSEVENRLEELFMEDEGADDKNATELSGSENDELRDLKAFVLSMDWEINDQVMTGLMEEIKKLGPLYEKDRILTLFLQLLGSIGKYIKANKSNSHPKSIKLLNSVYNSLEKAVRSENLTEPERKRLLQEEVNSFKKLKKEIALKKGIAVSEKRGPADYKGDATESPEVEEHSREKNPEAAKPAATGMSPEMAAALEEIKTVIRQEIKSLKDELKIWMEGK